MTTPNAEHLKGPWFAFLADHLGFVYESVSDALQNADDPDAEFHVRIVRDTAMPDDRSGDRLRLPGSWRSRDIAHEMACLYLDDDEDESVNAGARFAQAHAMTAGLNAAGGDSDAPR